MSDPVQRLAVSWSLWLIVAPLLGGFACHVSLGLSGGGARELPWVRRAGFASILVASAVVVWHAEALARAPGTMHGFVTPEVGGARITVLEAGFDLLFDRLSGIACSIACAAALAVAAVIATSDAARRRWPIWAWIELSLGGALLSFLANGFVTAILGWGLAVAATVWLAGWSQPRAGGARAARGALAILAMLIGASVLFWGRCGHWEANRYVLDITTLRPLDPGDATAAPVEPRRCGGKLSFREVSHENAGIDDAGGLALAAFLVACAAISASVPRATSPLPLSALDCGATTGLLGPFLLLRRAEGLPESQAAPRILIVIVGVALLAWLLITALTAARGVARGMVIAGGAPAGLTLVALGVDGSQGGLLVWVASGLAAVLLPCSAEVLGGRTVAAGATANARADLGGRTLEAGAMLLAEFERWVIDAIAGSLRVLVNALAWALARFDADVVGAPLDALATHVVRWGRALEHVVGVSFTRVTWIVIAALALVALGHALWLLH